MVSLVNLKSYLVALGFVLTSTLAHAAPAPLPSFAEIIKENGTVCITDGSSLFKFSKNGSFSQEPIFISGRTVQGKWTTDSEGALFTITGNWGWMNGMSPLSDPRRMVLVIYPGEFGTINFRNYHLRINKCYFEIEELVKTPVGDGAIPASH
jgi:hypothetical protein